LIDPYDDTAALRHLPAPHVPLAEIGVHRWHHDFWFKIIQAAVDGHPDEVPLDWHPALSRPAAMRYTASSPQLLNWVARWNQGKPYEHQIRPFGFLLSFMSRKGMFGPSGATLIDKSGPGRPPKADDLAPIAPYDREPALALSKVFDRVTGRPVRPERLKTYAEALVQYHPSPEHKFANGDHVDRGRTERRQVVATDFLWIGKEANQVGESGEAHPIASATEQFNLAQRESG
jgi:hypothetical protein